MDKNFKQHSPSCFTAKNQNGFNKALYIYFAEELEYNGYTKADVRQRVRNWPDRYPCTFIIMDIPSGGSTYIEFLDIESFSKIK